MHCPTPSQYCDTYGAARCGKSYNHTYQTIGPSTISSKLHNEHHYAKPDNMGNIEIIDSKKLCYDEMNNEI